MAIRRNRNAEWLIFRRTALLGDLVDEDGFVAMLRTSRKDFRNRRASGNTYGVEVPEPIYRTEGLKPMWIRREAEDFALKFNAKKATRGAK